MTFHPAEHYRERLQKDPKSEVFVEFGRMLESQNDLTEALSVCEEGLKHIPRAVTAHVLLGKILLRLGRTSDAMAAFDAAIAIERNHFFPSLLVAQVLLERSLYRLALPLLKKSVSLNSKHPFAARWLETAESALASKSKPPPWNSEAPDLFDQVPPKFAIAPASQLPVEPRTRPVANVVVPDEAKRPAPDAEVQIDIDEDFSEPTPIVNQAPPEPPVWTPPPPPLDPPPRPRGFLDEIPEFEGPSFSKISAVSSPSIGRSFSEDDRKEIALEYERNLREKLKVSTRPRVRWISALVVMGGIVVAASAVYFLTRLSSKGRSLQETLASARKSINLDTLADYRHALDDLQSASFLDGTSEEVWAYQAYIHALMFAEYGREAGHQRAAASALAHSGVRVHYPGWAVAADYYLSGMQPSDGLEEQIVSPSFELAELWDLGARDLLKSKNWKAALRNWTKALELSPNSVRSLSGLGEYYRQAGDCTSALKFYERALELSKEHAEARLGWVDCRLELGQEAASSLPQVESLREAPLSSAARQVILEARLLLESGRPVEGETLLASAAERFPDRLYDFDVVRAEAQRRAGHPLDAMKTLEKALRENPKGEEAMEAIGRLLLAKGAYREVLARFSGLTFRGTVLLRGIAYSKMRDWKNARVAFNSIQVAGKYPTEAVIYLALGDAEEGRVEESQKTLEGLLVSAKKSKNEIRVALGQIYLFRGALDRARRVLEEAAKDSANDEASFILGKLELQSGNRAVADKWLQQSVERNPLRSEAWLALGQLQSERGQREQALKSFQSASSSESVAWALYRLGRFAEAEKELEKAPEAGGPSARFQRLKAMVLFALGRQKPALAALEFSNKLDSKNAETFCEIGKAFARGGNRRGSAQAFLAAIRENPKEPCGQIGKYFIEPPVSPSLALRQLAALRSQLFRVWDQSFADVASAQLALAGAGTLKQAQAYAQAAVAEEPFSGMSHSALGRVYQQDGRIDDAVKEFEAAVQLDPVDGQAHFSLAGLLSRKVPPDSGRSLSEYSTFLSIGGDPVEVRRAQKLVAALRKKGAIQ